MFAGWSSPGVASPAAVNNQNPLRREFWLGPCDPRPLALFRIAIGLVVLHDLFDFTRDFRAFLTDDGMLPRSVQREWSAWSLFDLTGSLGGTAVLYALGVLAVISFTLGFWTRVSTALSWFWLVSLHNRNYYVTDGGDTLVGILFFWSMFADLGACWSLDARLRGRRTSAHVFALRLLQLHLVLLYYATSRLKIQKGWLHGQAIFQNLQLVGFVRPLGAWIGTHPALCTLGTYSILAMEVAFPICALSPIAIIPMRAMALAFGILIQLGICMAMRVGIFQEAMLAACSLFVLPQWFDLAIDRMNAWKAKRRAQGTEVREGSAAPDATPPRRPPLAATPAETARWRHALCAVLAFQFFSTAWIFFGERRFPLPSTVRLERKFLSIEQPADLFGTVYNIPEWSAPGVLSDGSIVDVLSVAAPGARPVSPGIQFSRWYKFTYKERDYPLPWPTLGPYLCRAYEEKREDVGGPKLASYEVINDEVPPRLPNEEPRPGRRRIMVQQSCR